MRIDVPKDDGLRRYLVKIGALGVVAYVAHVVNGLAVAKLEPLDHDLLVRRRASDLANPKALGGVLGVDGHSHAYLERLGLIDAANLLLDIGHPLRGRGLCRRKLLAARHLGRLR